MTADGLTRAERQAQEFLARAAALDCRRPWTWRKLAPCTCGLLCLAQSLDHAGRCAQCVADRDRIRAEVRRRERDAEAARAFEPMELFS